MQWMAHKNSVFGSNTYVVDDGRDCFIVDLGDFEPVAAYIAEKRLNVKAMLLTHTHYDHIYGIRRYMEAYPDAAVCTSEFGKEALTKPAWNFSRYHNDPIEITSDRIKTLCDGETIRPLDKVAITTIATPGHDMSSLTYRVTREDTPDEKPLLFTGDSYIPGVAVVATFPKSDKQLAAYWYDRLRDMEQSVIIMPGHTV